MASPADAGLSLNPASPCQGSTKWGFGGNHHHTLKPAYLATKPQGPTLERLVHTPQSLPLQCSSLIGRYAVESLLGDFSADLGLLLNTPICHSRAPKTPPLPGHLLNRLTARLSVTWRGMHVHRDSGAWSSSVLCNISLQFVALLLLLHPPPHSSMTRLSPDQREQLGDLAAFSPRTYSSLQAQFDCTYETVKRWEEVARTTRVFTDQPRSGRPKTVPGPQRKQARRLAKNKYTTRQIAQRVSKSSGYSISSTTVGRVLKGSRHPLQWAPVNRGRPLSAVNKLRREKWCKERGNSHTGTWLFCDSKFIYVYATGPNNTRYQWVDPEEEPHPVTGDLLYVMHFYCCVGKGFKSQLIFTAPTPPSRSKGRKGAHSFCSSDFIKVAQQLHKEIDSAEGVSQQYKLVLDGAKQHTSRQSRAALEAMGMQLLADFPPQSWDLNIIEYVWGVLDTKVCRKRGKSVTSHRGWRRRITAAWDEIEQATIDKLVAGVKQRMAQVVEKKGAWLQAKKG